MKRLFLFILLFSLLVGVLVACGDSATTTTEESKTSITSNTCTTTQPGAEQTTASETTTPNTENKTLMNTKWDGKTLKILAIGNSFSEDAMTYLFDIAKAEGIEDVILGNLYIGGCTLQRHYENSRDNKAEYEYRKNTNGNWVVTRNATLLDGIIDEDWDIITMQQASGSSGQVATYKVYLNPLVKYVKEHTTNPDCQFAWHLTWAYQQDSTHSEFPKYDKDQMTMYNAIISSVNKSVLALKHFPILIPSGTVVQNCRTSFFGDTLTRDGYHLNEKARYIAGYTWFATLTGKPLAALTYKPSSLGIDEASEALILEAINNALEKPLEITQSTYTEKPAIKLPDLSDYKEITFSYTVGAYWNSGDQNSHHVLTKTANNSKYFIATELFNRETLPVGSIILLEDGWQYRPERWKSDGPQSGRPDNVTEPIVYIDSAWWGDSVVRAFNIAVRGANQDITQMTDAIKNFKIYVPKNADIPEGEVNFDGTIGTTTTPDITEKPSTGATLPSTYDPDDYIKLDFDYTVGAYWNSSDKNGHHNLWASSDNSKYFIATELFTKETLPIGSIVVLDEGWQYRPERWKDDGQQQNRPGNSTDPILVITDEWWGEYTTRAFNIAKVGANTDIRNDPDAMTHFAIYIPKA